ncbi:MAG: aminotransferase class I/II-fold pyridoxal phosphate-dependent enzyme [Lewinellaceae bacterium]|nr:aminotransferase class I/II-fold pyridoxal phosphate-dependent enzyme [Lewinellaceae bacterium]
MLSNAPIPTVINQNLFGLRTSATVAINEKSKALEQTGKTIYKFGFGQSPFPVPDLVVEALKRHAHEKDYLAVRGLPALRDAIAKFTNHRKGTFAVADDVLVGPGSKELMFLLQLSYYGDIVIPAPSWVSYAPQAQIIGRVVTRAETRMANRLLLMPDELEAICQTDPERPRLVILNYPSNPTGSTYDKDTLQALAEVARRYKLIVLSDEIYGELNHRGTQDSIAQFYPEGTIISGGLSKWCGAGGWRLGFFVFPRGLKRLENAMAICASETFTSTSAPIQHAAVTAFLENPEIDQYLEHVRNALAAVGQYVYRELSAIGVTMPEPEGGFYLLPDFEKYREALSRRGIEDDRAFCQALLDEAGVALLPGSDFGCRQGTFRTRLSYVDFDGNKVLEACRNLPGGQLPDPAFVEKHCPKMVAGTQALCNWLKAL